MFSLFKVHHYTLNKIWRTLATTALCDLTLPGPTTTCFHHVSLPPSPQQGPSFYFASIPGLAHPRAFAVLVFSWSLQRGLLLFGFPLNISSLQRPSYKEEPSHHYLLIICLSLDYYLIGVVYFFTQLECNINCFAHCHALWAWICAQISVWLALGTQQTLIERCSWSEYAQDTTVSASKPVLLA